MPATEPKIDRCVNVDTWHAITSFQDGAQLRMDSASSELFLHWIWDNLIRFSDLGRPVAFQVWREGPNGEKTDSREFQDDTVYPGM